MKRRGVVLLAFFALAVALLCLLGGAFEAEDPEKLGYDMTCELFLPCADPAMASARVVFFTNDLREKNATVSAYSDDEFRQFRNGALRAFASWQTGVPIPPPKRNEAQVTQTVSEQTQPIQPPPPPGSAGPSATPAPEGNDDFSRQLRSFGPK